MPFVHTDAPASALSWEVQCGSIVGTQGSVTVQGTVPTLKSGCWESNQVTPFDNNCYDYYSLSLNVHMCEMLYPWCLRYSSQQFYEIATIISPIVQTRKQRP